ncbi:hypothetical protein NB713_003925 [Xanthomonas sacchari]|nr:hypothetical protein [Xanthomonas sacchari]
MLVGVRKASTATASICGLIATQRSAIATALLRPY